MKRAVAIIILMTMSPLGGLRATALGQQLETAKLELQGLFEALTTALANRDRAALEQIYADEFLFVHATTGVVGKKQQIDAIMASAGNTARDLKPSLDNLIVHGDVAMLRTTNRDIQGTNVYIKRGGRWRILQVQGTLLPTPRTPTSLDPKDLDAYVGSYEFPAGLAVVTREGDALFWQATGRPKFRLLPLDSSRFFGEGSSSEMHFRRAASGAVEAVNLRLGTCQDSTGKKVK